GVDLHARQVLREIELEFELLAFLAREDLDRAAHGRVDVERYRISRMRARIGEKASDHAIQAIDLFEDDPDELRRAGIARRRSVEELRGALDRAERIFDLIR